MTFPPAAMDKSHALPRPTGGFFQPRKLSPTLPPLQGVDHALRDHAASHGPRLPPVQQTSQDLPSSQMPQLQDPPAGRTPQPQPSRPSRGGEGDSNDETSPTIDVDDELCAKSWLDVRPKSASSAGTTDIDSEIDDKSWAEKSRPAPVAITASSAEPPQGMTYKHEDEGFTRGATPMTGLDKGVFIPSQQCDCRDIDHAAVIDFFKDGLITFGLLSTLMRPGETLYTSQISIGIEGCFRLERLHTTSLTSYVHGLQFDTDGNRFGWIPVTYTIQRFYGAKRISALEVFPLKYHPMFTEIEAKLKARGDKFLSLATMFHHRQYRGKATLLDHEQEDQVRSGNEDQETYIDGRVVVDVRAFWKCHPQRPRMHALQPVGLITSGCSEAAALLAKDCQGFELAQQDLMNCNPVVPAFSLQRGIWGFFTVADMSEIEWSLEPFQGLWLPEDAMEVATLFKSDKPNNPSHESTNGVDKGIVILLHGPPGVGKSTTTKAVAEQLRRPLLAISHATMPHTRRDFARQLDHGLRWDAITVLEEAELCLGQSPRLEDFRNLLVSRADRPGESMILIVHQIEKLDSRIRSRVDVEIEYPALNKDARKDIWDRELCAIMLYDVSLSEQEHELLERVPINGWEISAACRIGRKLAASTKTLSYCHLSRFLPRAAQLEARQEAERQAHQSSIDQSLTAQQGIERQSRAYESSTGLSLGGGNGKARTANLSTLTNNSCVTQQKIHRQSPRIM